MASINKLSSFLISRSSSSSSASFYLPFNPSYLMEDCNMLAADCVVICCACPCLIILQILIFFFLKMPRALIRKSRKYVKRKINDWNRKQKEAMVEFARTRFKDDEILEFHGGSCLDVGNCTVEVERVLEEISLNGKFAFGSFWGWDGSRSSGIAEEFDFSVAQFKLVELISTSLSY